MKTCPFCAEEIQDAAVKCKHCGATLNRVPAGRLKAFGFLGVVLGLPVFIFGSLAAAMDNIGWWTPGLGALLFVAGLVVFVAGRLRD